MNNNQEEKTIAKDPGMNTNNNQEKTTNENMEKETNNNSDKTINANSENTKYNGTANLVPFSKDNVDKAKECGRIGGKKSGESKRRKKAAKEYLNTILATTIPEENVDEILGEAKILCNGDYTAYNVLWCKLLQLGLAGDVKATALLRDTAGDKPADVQQTELNVITEQDRAQMDRMRKELMSIIS